jgi:hypothetical protein
MEVTLEGYCEAMASYSTRCGNGPEWKEYLNCIAVYKPVFDDMDPCYLGIVMRSCFEHCEWRTCAAEAYALTHP